MAGAHTHVDRIVKALTEVAQIASVMLDGDEASRIITERAAHYIATPDPEYRFLSGDYYDVDHDTFLRMKKTLLRLERLLDFPCDTALWVQVPRLEGYVTLAVQNGNVHRYYRFGADKLKLPDEIAECFATGQTTIAPMGHSSQTVTVLAPVFNSLGDVIGVVELSAQHPESQHLSPAWS